VLVCHRGASALAPENSLEAFRVALAHGVDFSELDVHVGRDGAMIVSHDPVSVPAIERTLPRLAQVFDLVRDEMGIYVELKARHGRRARESCGSRSRVPDLTAARSSSTWWPKPPRRPMCA
jgi:glycerophosphoryl diester phosphodiesterase